MSGFKGTGGKRQAAGVSNDKISFETQLPSNTRPRKNSIDPWVYADRPVSAASRAQDPPSPIRAYVEQRAAVSRRKTNLGNRVPLKRASVSRLIQMSARPNDVAGHMWMNFCFVHRFIGRLNRLGAGPVRRPSALHPKNRHPVNNGECVPIDTFQLRLTLDHVNDMPINRASNTIQEPGRRHGVLGIRATPALHPIWTDVVPALLFPRFAV